MQHQALYIIKITAILGWSLVFSPQPVSAQTQKGDKEIEVSYGRMSGTEIVGMSTIAYGIYEDGEYTQTAHSGNYFATFRLYLLSFLALGVTGGVQTLAYNYQNTGQKYNFPDFSTNATVMTFSPELKLQYFHPSRKNGYAQNKSFQLYGLIGAGVRYFDEKQTPNTPNHTLPSVFINTQLSPLGFRVGGNFGAFLELGFGYKGLVNFGLSYRISRKTARY